MEINIITVGKIASNWIKEGVILFETRISRYINFSVTEIPDIRNAKSLPIETIKDEEGKAILSKINPGDFVALLDEKGNDVTSRKFSEWLQNQMNASRKRLVFIIGGPFGFSQLVYSRANYMMALSKMTLTHEMARLLLTEQIYRAFTILRGEPYHHD